MMQHLELVRAKFCQHLEIVLKIETKNLQAYQYGKHNYVKAFDHKAARICHHIKLDWSLFKVIHYPLV